MEKYKKLIIIFSLILSVLFLNINNISGVYCATTIVNVNITNFEGDTNNLNFYYKYPMGKFKQYGVRELDGITYLTFTYSSTFSSSEYSEFSLYYNNELIEIESISSSGSEIFVIPIFKPIEEENTETTETTETTESTETTEENNNNVVIDNTGVIKELQEIKSYLLMFFASFFLYFGYKIVKETTNKKGDKL